MKTTERNNLSVRDIHLARIARGKFTDAIQRLTVFLLKRLSLYSTATAGLITELRKKSSTDTAPPQQQHSTILLLPLELHLIRSLCTKQCAAQFTTGTFQVEA